MVERFLMQAMFAIDVVSLVSTFVSLAFKQWLASSQGQCGSLGKIFIFHSYCVG